MVAGNFNNFWNGTDSAALCPYAGWGNMANRGVGMTWIIPTRYVLYPLVVRPGMNGVPDLWIVEKIMIFTTLADYEKS